MKAKLISIFAIVIFAFSGIVACEIFVSTIPKSGTFFIDKIIGKLCSKNKVFCKELTSLSQEEFDTLACTDFYMSHAPCVPSNYDIVIKNNLKVVLLIRDPRDVLVSYAYWVKKGHGHRLEPGWQEYYDRPVDNIITLFIKKYPTRGPAMPEYSSIVEFYKMYLEWLKYPQTFMTKFENLIGEKGGGNNLTQEAEIFSLANFCGTPITQEQVHTFAERIFGDGTTFREGKIGSWRNHLTEEQISLLKAIPGFNELLIELGYEEDDNW